MVSTSPNAWRNCSRLSPDKNSISLFLIFPFPMTVEQYPVLETVDELRRTLLSSPVVILQAPPGAGKSTVLPLQLMNESWLQQRKIIMLEPRRLAAKAVAERMADLLNENAGETIGYRVRFDTKVSSATRVEVVTEGILTRMIQTDNSLEEAGLLIFDEFHERSIHADLALALSLQIQQILRPDLKILIMSATLDSESLSLLLKAPVITSKGRQFPVDLRYALQEGDQSLAVRVHAAIRKALVDEDGDVLVFLPGTGDINRVHQMLEESEVDAVVYPLYGDLNFRKQQEAILPRRDGRRKVVLATSIAETSLTIEGIKVVIDSGWSRVPRFDPRSGLTRLETVRVTKDAADQRAGRAGRLGPGVCYRLWTTGIHLSLADQRKPEILEADLAPLMLELAQWGIKNVNDLVWVSRPPAGSVSQALELLRNLDAIDENGITIRGRDMLSLPTHPRIAHMLLTARQEKSEELLSLATDVASLLEERDPLGRDAGADATLRVDALRKWRNNERVAAERNVLERIERLAQNWRRLMKAKLSNTAAVETELGKLLWAAYPERLAQQQGKHSARYKLLTGRIVSLPSHDSLLREEWICAAQLDAGAQEGKVFLAAAVHLDDLATHARQTVVVKWDEAREMIVSLSEKRIGPLLLESRQVSNTIREEKRIEVLCSVIREKGLKIIGDPEVRHTIQARVQSLHRWRPNEAWPDISDEYLINGLEEWLAPFLSGVSKLFELQKLDVRDVLTSILPWELHSKLDTLAPERIQVPSGSMIRLQYFKTGEPPVLEVRLQEMFGLADTPAVNEGRTKVKLHLLSPGFKPVQVTQDLRSFWQTTYHEVRKELRVRYPKHHWPDDPWTAEAVRGAKRRS
jgi:ATP-dependent helicase HrpB